MAGFLVLCLILWNVFVIVAKANNAASLANQPASSPSSNKKKQDIAQAPQIRRFGKHQHKMVRSSAAPSLSPAEAPLPNENMHNHEGISSLDQVTAATQVQDIQIEKKHHHSIDKSVAGGGVILGGLGATFFVAIVCYIRATRRKNVEPASPSSAKV